MEPYLRHCLDSLIIDKGMDELEVFVINDGSKDRSSKIAREYQDKYPNTFYVIDKVNGNYGSCINRGLKEATGKYIKVLDADDCFNARALQDVIQRLMNIDTDVILTNYVIVRNEKTESFFLNYADGQVVNIDSDVVACIMLFINVPFLKIWIISRQKVFLIQIKNGFFIPC